MSSKLNPTMFLHIFIHFMMATPLLATSSDGNNGEENLSAKINQLRGLVEPHIFPNYSRVHNYIRDNLYVSQWLQTGGNNVESAYKNLMDHLSWRNLEKIDGIHLENWVFMKADYPQFFNTVDKMGRPVAEVWLSDWDIRRAVLSGLSNKLIRWITHNLEMTQRKVFEIRQGNKNISNALEIIDVEGFNSWTQGCMSCIPIYINWGQVWEKHYPSLWSNIYMINVSPAFRTFIGFGNNFHHSSKGLLQMYATKRNWMPKLDKEISKEQRSARFGGYFKRSSHPENDA